MIIIHSLILLNDRAEELKHIHRKYLFATRGFLTFLLPDFHQTLDKFRGEENLVRLVFGWSFDIKTGNNIFVGLSVRYVM